MKSWLYEQGNVKFLDIFTDAIDCFSLLWVQIFPFQVILPDWVIRRR